jgi:hypothetical protein
MPTIGAPLGTGVPLVNLDQGPPIPNRFVLQLPHQFAPRRIRNRRCQPTIADQLLDSQRLHTHRLVLTNETRGELVQPVKPLVGDTCVRTRDLAPRLLSILGAFQATGKALLRFLEPMAAAGEMLGLVIFSPVESVTSADTPRSNPITASAGGSGATASSTRKETK